VKPVMTIEVLEIIDAEPGEPRYVVTRRDFGKVVATGQLTQEQLDELLPRLEKQFGPLVDIDPRERG
jgi:hypothetical protein